MRTTLRPRVRGAERAVAATTRPPSAEAVTVAMTTAPRLGGASTAAARGPVSSGTATEPGPLAVFKVVELLTVR